MGDQPYAIGDDNWPGLSKLIEEAGEVIQVAGKLIATGGEPDHWDGSNLRERMIEELADLGAAARFFIINNFDLGERNRITDRTDLKFERFEEWHHG